MMGSPIFLQKERQNIGQSLPSDAIIGLSSGLIRDTRVAPKQFSLSISTEDWPSNNKDLNLLDYKLWSVLENLVSLKRC